MSRFVTSFLSLYIIVSTQRILIIIMLFYTKIIIAVLCTIVHCSGIQVKFIISSLKQAFLISGNVFDYKYLITRTVLF